MNGWRYVAAAAAAATATIGLAGGLAGGSRHGDDALDQVRQATAEFRNVQRAIDAEYVQFFGCVHEPLAGAMGIHFVNGELVGDTVIDASTPEAVMYEVRASGKLELVGVEYIVFQSAWDAEHATRPELFGEPFNLVAEPNRFGIPAFYELHAWAWKENPTGPHQDWNPQVLCPNTEGHTP